MPGTKTSRWLDLLAFLLQHRYPVTRDQILAAVAGYQHADDSDRARESARRKFIRDKNDLERLGIKIRTVPLPEASTEEATEAYQLAPRDFYLPYLELITAPTKRHRPYSSVRQIRVTREDVRRLDQATAKLAAHPTFPLAAAAASARRKLGFDLPLSARIVEGVLADPVSADTSAALAVLQRATADRAAVRCRYWSIGRDEEATRVIEPLGLFYHWSRWYCVARDRQRQAIRTFRLDRVRHAEPIDGAEARFHRPPGFTVRSYIGRAPWELSDAVPTPVRARLAFPESRWVMAQGLGTVNAPTLDDGGAILEFAVREPGPFLRWGLTMGDHFVVLAPDRIRRDLEALRQRVAALYGNANE